jgi:hypothetical protein
LKFIFDLLRGLLAQNGACRLLSSLGVVVAVAGALLTLIPVSKFFSTAAVQVGIVVRRDGL